MQEGTQHFFGGGGDTVVTAFALAIAAIAAILLLAVPRRFVCVPFLAAVVLIPIDQQIMVGPVHVTLARLLILVAGGRLLLAGTSGAKAFKSTRMDLVVFAYCASTAVTFIILWGGEGGAIINRCGFLLNYLGAYWVMRLGVRTVEDLERCVKCLVWVFVLISVGMIAEQASGRNIFAVVGGVPSESVTRNGKIRAQGPFIHPLTAGTAGATMLPLAIGLWWVSKGSRKKRGNRCLALAGTAACFAMAGASMSSSAPLTVVAGLFGLWLWPWRNMLSLIRWSVLALLVVLHVFMKAPVWALISRIDLTGSSSGYHRYMLVEQFFQRFAEWWLVGSQGTNHWGIDMWDTINSYVAAGTGGGLITFLLYIGVYVVGFKTVGQVRRQANDMCKKWGWILGCVLFAHAVAVFGIAYFDQSQFVWLFNLAALASVSSIDPNAGVNTQRIDASRRRPDDNWLVAHEIDSSSSKAHQWA
jgi:hypothetical protein